MLIIRKEQEDALTAASEREFVRRMVPHLRETFPLRTHGMNDESIRQLVQGGISRARQRGYTLELSVCLYLHIVLLLGAEFDGDKAEPWVRKVRDDQSLKDPHSRLEYLHEMALVRAQ